jgi:hypothetical protein
MNIAHPPHVLAADAVAVPPEDPVLWFHAAFCSMALPMDAGRGAWQRDVDSGYIRVEPGVSGDVVPSGRILRLCMMHICDAAVRTQSQVIELGGDSTLLAAALGVDVETEALADPWRHLQAARILMSGDGGSEVSVFDARSRRRASHLEWRSGVRLSSKFLASLVAHAIPLDRRVVRELSATPEALDAYAWVRMSVQHAAADQIVTTTWGDLLKRFGTASQVLAEFRSTFEAALRLVFEADRSIDLAVDDDAVRVRHADPADIGTSAGGTIYSPLGADVGEVHASETLERLEVPRSTMPVVMASQGPRPISRTLQKPSAGQAAPNHQPAAAAAGDRIKRDDISLPGHLTGLAVVIWLRRGHSEDNIVVGVTPGPRFEAERLTVLAVEPMVLQVSGGLNERDFERVSAWVMSNRDVIDEFWEGRITSFAEINQRVRKAPAQGWR